MGSWWSHSDSGWNSVPFLVGGEKLGGFVKVKIHRNLSETFLKLLGGLCHWDILCVRECVYVHVH